MTGHLDLTGVRPGDPDWNRILLAEYDRVRGELEQALADLEEARRELRNLAAWLPSNPYEVLGR